MNRILAAASALALLPAAALAAEPPKITHFPAGAPPAAGAVGPAFSGAVMAGNTLYVSGTTDTDRATVRRWLTSMTEGAAESPEEFSTH